MGNGITALAVVAHELFGNGLKEVLQVAPDPVPAVSMEVHTDLKSALDFADEDPLSPIRLVVIDIDAPMVSGKSSLDALHRRFPSADMVVVAAPQERAEVLEILGWGVHGIILRTQTADEIRHAIGIVLKGGIFVPKIAMPRIAGPRLVDPMRVDPRRLDPRLAGPAGARDAGAPASRDERVSHIPHRPELRLSLRQSAVLALLTEGLSNKAIARKLDLAEATVKVHVNAIYRALNVHNRASAVAAVLVGRMTAPRAADASLDAALDASLDAGPTKAPTKVAGIRST